MRKPELLAPGGGFAAAYQAFEAGADGVYLGLSEFSARRAATNFTLEQLRRILGLARLRGRKVYVTLNTVVREEEMPRVATLCAWLESLGVDGVIVQDLGVSALLRRGFPGLAVHASTQMAIHNDSGLRFAREAGIRRVILSRELTLDRIRELRANHPDIELEVFIHGALCYSFSGVCLASWALTGRSGNRGDCAQVCRSVFCSGQERDSTPFSCRDLSLGAEVLKLAEIGIDSLKIEGRMKSPEYVFHVTRLYREILDKGAALSEAALGELQRNAEATFSREKTSAYFHSPRAKDLLTKGYPGHRGIPLGTVTQTRGREIGLRLQSRVSLHDGAGFWQPASSEPVIFPVMMLRRGARPVRYAQAGEAVFITADGETPLPPLGTRMRLFSSRFLDRPLPKEAGFTPIKVSLRLEATLTQKEGIGVLACSVGDRGEPFAFSASLTLVDSTGGKSFEGVLRKLLGESGDSPVRIAELSFSNETGRADNEIFVQPSELKKARNEILAALEKWFLSSLERRVQRALLSTARNAGAFAPADLAALSRREMLSPPATQPVPFASLEAVRKGPAAFASRGGLVFVPLPPVMLDDEAWIESLQTLCAAHREARFAIGLNNVGQLVVAGRLAGQENCSFFVDYFLYAANRSAVSFLAARVARLLFLYSWIEGGEETLRLLAAPEAVRIAEGYRPPLFYSLGCYQRHALGGGKCGRECGKDFVYELRQGKNRFDVVVKDCVTYLFQKPKEDREGPPAQGHESSSISAL